MKPRRYFVCEACGHREAKWLGRCPSCEAWSTLVEAVESAAPVVTSSVAVIPLNTVSTDATPRLHIGIEELDRVLGGGLMPGSLTLVGGDPGIGKSTLLLQAMAELARRGQRVLYVTAEESAAQVKARADRLGVPGNGLFLLADTSLEAAERARDEVKPHVWVIDSIQTVGMQSLESAVGSVAQIRAVTQRLMHCAKGEGLSTFVVGHVTKDGAIAGPKMMEHMVDTVLYFEGENSGPYRILRAHKNRFGSAQEIGVFEMHAEGLRPVSNPSELFLSERAQGPGSVVMTSLQGSRPLLLEVQALTTSSPYGTPRRTAIGFDSQRVAMLCAVLESRAGLQLSGFDVYVNIAGGVRVSEPAADLGVALALASSVLGKTVPNDTVVVGEIGLSGEVRGVAQIGARLQEAEKLGFARAIVPSRELQRWQGPKPNLELIGVANMQEALALTAEVR